MDEENFKISDVLFKIIISSSLPLSWDLFTESYVGGQKGVIETNQKKLMGSQQFIGILKEEYIQRQLWIHTRETVNQTFNPKRSLQNRLTSKSSTNSDKYCKHCGCNNHNTIDCIHLGKSKCPICSKFGHTADKCWKKGKGKRNREDEDENEKKKQKKAEINEAEEEEIITLNTEEIVTQEVSKDKPFFDDDEEGYNFNKDNLYNMNQINEPVIYYEWFTDSATSSLVMNKCDTFITYKPLYNTSVVGVGQIKAKVEGKGTVKLLTWYNKTTKCLIYFYK